MTIGDTLASIRILKRIDQQTLAKEVGIAKTYLCDIERERKRPSIKLLYALAEKLDTPLEHIILTVLREKYPKNKYNNTFFQKVVPLVADVLTILSDPCKEY